MAHVHERIHLHRPMDDHTTQKPHGRTHRQPQHPETIAIIAIILLHLWKKNMLLSIAGGTATYMLLIQLVF